MEYSCSICKEWKNHDDYPPEADFREGAHEDSMVCPDCVIEYEERPTKDIRRDIDIVRADLHLMEKDRDDWKAIAEMNADIIDRLRAQIEAYRDLEEE